MEQAETKIMSYLDRDPTRIDDQSILRLTGLSDAIITRVILANMPDEYLYRGHEPTSYTQKCEYAMVSLLATRDLFLANPVRYEGGIAVFEPYIGQYPEAVRIDGKKLILYPIKRDATLMSNMLRYIGVIRDDPKMVYTIDRTILHFQGLED